ncbi:putative nitratenitrite response regulator protein [Pedobacter sp. BAL39]|uniref:response regulator transcription factor n=1 Tax=Pedobacter sp. BAL39 TaxID=391596 RepID=UPI0001559269|nr:response regulator transcription factor [Pedobacter sp. BAL39]EDM38499.1 putative nitratenitrite response regulator protein [Pedobacter sp. BAL39]
MVRILIADDYPLTLMGTKAYVELLGYRVVGTCANGLVALNLIQQLRPDMAILDINMPGIDGVDILQKLHQQQAYTRVILLTMHREAAIYKRALNYKLSGYLLKEHADTELADCIRAVSGGLHYKSKYLDASHVADASAISDESLSPIERRIVALVAGQKTSKQIGESLFLAEKTVEGHRSRIISKLRLPKEKNALLKWALSNIKR